MGAPPPPHADGHVTFEVGEVKAGTVGLEETVIPAGIAAGLTPVLVLVNAPRFTKAATCWGVANNDWARTATGSCSFARRLERGSCGSHHLPVNRGGRLARNAATPSLKSALV